MWPWEWVAWDWVENLGREKAKEPRIRDFEGLAMCKLEIAKIVVEVLVEWGAIHQNPCGSGMRNNPRISRWQHGRVEVGSVDWWAQVKIRDVGKWGRKVWKWKQGAEAAYPTSRPVGGMERKHWPFERPTEEDSIRSEEECKNENLNLLENCADHWPGVPEGKWRSFSECVSFVVPLPAMLKIHCTCDGWHGSLSF